MNVTIEIAPEWESRLERRAKARGQNLSSYLHSLVEREISDDENRFHLNSDAMSRSVRQLQSRTIEERAALRKNLLETARPARPVPEGKTLEELIVGKWPGDETDEEIETALRELS